MPRLAFPWIVTVPFLLAAAGAVADDWPQWAGPHRDSVWRETGVVKEFPQDGLPIVWRSPVGLGYAGPAVAAGRAFVMDYSPSEGEVSNNPTARARLQGKERVLCFSAKDGKPLWQHEYDCAYEISYPSGPRCTPTVVGDRVYTLGAQGRLSCLDAADGRVVWAKELTEEYKTKTPIWGYASHPLVAGDLLISLVGGEGSVAVAFDKQTGREVWRALSGADPGYCPPTLIEHAGVQQLLIWTPESVNSLDPQTGKVHWSLPLAPNYGMS
ncbi:MAG: PQQ-like beta-propeller repeat protein, partial [Planctomycetales bacterium]|nr:PQQ-like beta-propeller repeat protein [Planctomycetales bacterium]